MTANPLDIRTVIEQVQSALTDTIDLAYRYRFPVPDLPALASSFLAYPGGQSATTLPERNALAFVQSEGVVYKWVESSTLAPVPRYVIAPAKFPAQSAGNGRWLRQSTSTTLGLA